MKLLNCIKILNRFERVLWFVSLAVVAGSFLLIPERNYLTLAASLIGVSALIFVAKGHIAGQILSVVFAAFYGIISFCFRYYGEMITYLCMTSPIAIMSVVSWYRHPYKDSAEVEVNRITRKQVGWLCVLTIAVTAVFGILLYVLGNANLLFSILSVTTSFLASALTFLRSPYYALAYAANDVILIVLWILAAWVDISYLPMIFCFGMFLVNDLYGFLNWKRIYRRQSNFSVSEE